MILQAKLCQPPGKCIKLLTGRESVKSSLLSTQCKKSMKDNQEAATVLTTVLSLFRVQVALTLANWKWPLENDQKEIAGQCQPDYSLSVCNPL